MRKMQCKNILQGQRALDFVLRNQGLIDKTLLFDIELLKIIPNWLIKFWIDSKITVRTLRFVSLSSLICILLVYNELYKA